MPSEKEGRLANRLADETSAYLRQHMHNPVDWYPWGDEALAKARDEDKPILLSVGYSACHWCHVMEHESFEDPATAAVMNELYVCIKVDREERPDVDQLYMDVLLRMQGHGGWPMTVFCRPDGSPYHAGTYYPPRRHRGMPSFQEVLRAAESAYRDRRGQIDQTVGAVIESLAARPRDEQAPEPDRNSLSAAAASILQNADAEYGGSSGAPKFPTPTGFELLLAALDLLPEGLAAKALLHCQRSCREMARRGLFDHLAGGFHRYCVDERWEIPHFEKMLYDQGLLLGVYAETWRRSGLREPPDDDLAWPMRESIAYLQREMTGPEGGFYASQDADSEGEEGKFYVFTPGQIDAALGDAARGFKRAYGVTRGGNFEHSTTHLNDRAREPRPHFSDEREQLRKLRSERIAPATDTKRVTSWNGYAIAGIARAACLLDDAAALDAAARAADFLLEKQRDAKGNLLRVYDGGRSHVSGFLDDYAALIDACLALQRAGAGNRFLAHARDLALDAHRRFFDAAEGDFFFTPNDGEALVFRPRTDNDGATPQSSGLATLGFLRIAELCGEPALRDAANAVLSTHATAIARHPHAHVTMLRSVAALEAGMRTVIVVGDANDELTRSLAACSRRELLVHDTVVVALPGEPVDGLDASWLAGREARDGRATAYVCTGTLCSAPVQSLEALERELRAPRA